MCNVDIAYIKKIEIEDFIAEQIDLYENKNFECQSFFAPEIRINEMTPKQLFELLQEMHWSYTDCADNSETCPTQDFFDYYKNRKYENFVLRVRWNGWCGSNHISLLKKDSLK